jgi:MFS family permease
MSKTTRSAAGIVLVTLCAGQFLMALDTSVMNVSIAQVANDVHSDVTGIQTAITMYTLVMAAFMITGGKLGEIWGRKRAFSIGAIVYGCGSFVTAIAPNLLVLMLGWSLLEGLGAALMLPAIVALVATNFAKPERPRAYGLLAAAAAIAIAVGPIIGGLFTTYLTWRLVFAGEVVGVAVILFLGRKMVDVAPEKGKLDLVGTVLSASGLALVVFGILRSGTWGLVQPKPGAPVWIGLSPVIWLILGGGVILFGFGLWEARLTRLGKSPLVNIASLRIPQLRAGLSAFFFQFLAQMGLFFVVPLYLSVALGLSAIETGVRILPLSIGLLLAAALTPKFFPNTSPRLISRIGFLLLFAGIVVLMGALEVGAGPEIVLGPLFLAGLGMGALASQLGSVTVASVPESEAGQVGGLQNTVTNLGASVGTALAGAVLIASLTSTFLAGIASDPAVPKAISEQATVQLQSGAPFVSDAQLEAALHTAGVPADATKAIVDENTASRLTGLRSALAVLALIVLIGLPFTGGLPNRPPTVDDAATDADDKIRT